MKRLHLLGLLLLLVGLSFNELRGQTINFTTPPWSTDPTNPVTICQCDTFDIRPPNNTSISHQRALRYFLNQNFNPNTEFFFEFAAGGNFLNADTLEVIDIVRVDAGNVYIPDTFSGPAQHSASIIIPCNATLGSTSLRIRNSNGTISDTLYFLVNRIPDPTRIKSVIGGFPNPYTVALNDWGFCEGDSVILEAEQQTGANYQWLRNGVPIVGETDTIYVVRSSGIYGLRVDLGACSRESRDTLINAFKPPTNIEFIPSARAFQIDNPDITNVSRDDSIMFCENVTVTLEAPIPPPPGVTFSYQWLTDTIDPNSGNPVFFPVDTVSAGFPRSDTSQTVVIDSSLISFRGGVANIYLAVDDGFCVDTSDFPIILFMDSVPETRVANRLWAGGALLPSAFNSDVCMKEDSLQLISSYVAPNIRYQWQRSLNGTSWTNLPSTSNPDEVGTQRVLEVDTGYNPKPTPTITYYRLRTTTVTPFNGDVVCSYTSDSVRVRWLPDYRIEVTPGQPQATFIAPDTVSLCAIDSVQIRGPISPNSFTLPYDYSWFKDTVNAIGQTVKTPTGPNDTLRALTVDQSGSYYIVFDDGICIDTSRAIYVYVDTIPRTNLVSRPFAGIPPKPDPFDRCLYDSVQITATDTVIPGWDYQWQQYIDGTIGWIDLAADTNPSIVVDTSYTPIRDTMYFRLVINYTNRFGLPGCEFISDSVQVRFYELPEVTFFPSDSVGLCSGEDVRVVAEGNALSYRWADGPLGASRVFTNTGTYTLIAVGVNNCEKEYEVDIYDITVQANAGSDRTVVSGEEVNLSASGGTFYRWFANKPLAFSNNESPNTIVEKVLEDDVLADTVIVYVTVTGDDGCSDTDSLTLVINSARGKDLVLLERAYNLFTPNGDTRNDVWDITDIVNEATGCGIVIMNRWGSTLYEEDDFQGVWDGTDSGGNPLPDGTYYYILTCDDEVLLKSAVTIIRNE